MNANLRETSSFTVRDEKWFTAASQTRKKAEETKQRNAAPIDDPIADRWFRGV
jgi:hypothetical protein